MGFLELRQEPGVYSRVTAGMTLETLVCSLKSGTCLGMRDNSGIKTRHGRKIQTLLEVKWDFRSLFLFDTVILGFLTILKNCQASS